MGTSRTAVELLEREVEALGGPRDERARFTVIVPVRSARCEPVSISALLRNRSRKVRPEVLVTVGRCPSEQRNRAAEEAEGNVLAFLDEDVTPSAQWLARLSEWYANPRVVGVCGPNVAPPGERNLVPRAVDVVLTSRFGVFGKENKYRGTRLSEAGDNRLILCNASFRREFFFEVGGFRPELYPNEENEFLERARGALGDRWILYDPRLVVYRARPARVVEHLRTVFGYGVGRVNQLLTAPSACSLANLLPAVCFLAGLVMLALARWSWLFVVPHVLYAMVLAGTCAYQCARRGHWSLMPLLWLLYPGTHAGYALGQMWALLRLQSRSGRVNLDAGHIQVVRIDGSESGEEPSWLDSHSGAAPVTVVSQ